MWDCVWLVVYTCVWKLLWCVCMFLCCVFIHFTEVLCTYVIESDERSKVNLVLVRGDDAECYWCTLWVLTPTCYVKRHYLLFGFMKRFSSKIIQQDFSGHLRWIARSIKVRVCMLLEVTCLFSFVFAYIFIVDYYMPISLY